MIIYDQEQEDGLTQKILASSSIAYASVAEPCSVGLSKKDFKSLASYDDNDLYYVQSILVTSSWNKNDDIFDKYEVWSAKNTPEHKPTNLEHNESLIVGHIISNWPITMDGVLIDKDTPVENLPDKFHILTGSVIYKAFSNIELRERAEKLISEIQSGTKFVSMECLFKGFDYGLINKNTSEYKVLSRNNDTAYLTKYLRAYGGAGENNDYKIGRVLRNITFTGKGFVDKPANEDSIIFNKELFNEEKNDDFSNLGVSTIQLDHKMENNTMSVEQDMSEIKNKLVAMETSCQEAVAEANASVNSLKQQNADLESKLLSQTNEFTERETAMKKELEEVKASASDELSALKESLEAQIAELSQVVAMKDEEMKKKDEEVKKMKAELDAANETVAAYKTKEEEMVKKEKMMKRKAALTENGIEDDAALAFVEKFQSMEDEAFDAMATLFAAMKSKKEEAMKMKMKASEDEEAATEETPPAVTASVLDEVETQEEVNLSVGSDSSEEEDTTRAALVEFVYSKLGKKSK